MAGPSSSSLLSLISLAPEPNRYPLVASLPAGVRLLWAVGHYWRLDSGGRPRSVSVEARCITVFALL